MRRQQWQKQALRQGFQMNVELQLRNAPNLRRAINSSSPVATEPHSTNPGTPSLRGELSLRGSLVWLLIGAGYIRTEYLCPNFAWNVGDLRYRLGA